MECSKDINHTHNRSFLLVRNLTVIDVNDNTCSLLMFSKEDMLGKTIEEISHLLRCNFNLSADPFDKSKSLFIFNKLYDPIEVVIEIETLNEKDTIYFIEEVPNSKIEDKMPLFSHLFKDNEFGMSVFSVPDIRLLKTNQIRLASLEKPFNSKDITIGRELSELTPNWTGSMSEDIWKKVLKTGEPFQIKEYEFTFRGKTNYWDISLIPIFENGSMKYIIEMTKDITENVMQRSIIVEQKKKLDAIIAHCSDGLVMLDKDKNITLLNEAARKFYYNPELIKKVGDSQPVTKYYDINGDIIESEDLPGIKALNGEKANDIRVVAKRPDKTMHVNINGSPIFDLKGELIGSLASIRYLDTIVRYEEMLKEQRDELERVLEMKEEFFSYMSHEFKTPLTVMLSTIQLLKLVYKDEITEKIMKYINKLNLSALQQLRLVNNIVDITKGESGYLRVNQRNLDIVSMTKVIVGSVTNFAVRKNVHIKFHTDISELILAIDDEKYERILLNLLSNAIKFTPKDKSIYINLNLNDDKVAISIRDEGVGIPEDKLDMIFKRFGQVNSSLTREGEGSGIGLCLVKVLVEALNGDIKVESTLEEGSIFAISLPILTIQEDNIDASGQLLDNRLVQSMDIEFSTIYFD